MHLQLVKVCLQYTSRDLISVGFCVGVLKERFMAYIKGGMFEEKEYPGCKDKKDPVDLGWMYVPYRLYFAKQSGRWDNGGVAFLTCEKEPDPEYHAIVRLWKITESQFEDIQKQEGGYYNKILYLGEKDGLPIKTITGCWLNKINPPSERYLNIIKKGLKETTGWDDEKITDYLEKFIRR